MRAKRNPIQSHSARAELFSSFSHTRRTCGRCRPGGVCACTSQPPSGAPLIGRAERPITTRPEALGQWQRGARSARVAPVEVCGEVWRGSVERLVRPSEQNLGRSRERGGSECQQVDGRRCFDSVKACFIDRRHCCAWRT